MSAKEPGRLDGNDFAIREEILKHLEARPRDDTWEGILEWWLMERTLERETQRVHHALAALVDEGIVQRRLGEDGRFHFGLRPAREETR